MDGVDTDGDGFVNNDHVCLQIGSGDGFATMADGYSQYTFGFSRYGGLYNAGGTDPNEIQADWPADPVPDPGNAGNMWNANEVGLILAANVPAPTIEVRQGQSLFLSLHNVGMLMRPDLFDPHTVHYHGFPNVASIFDGRKHRSLCHLELTCPGRELQAVLFAEWWPLYLAGEPGQRLRVHMDAAQRGCSR
jgi:hypothetical protein